MPAVDRAVMTRSNWGRGLSSVTYMQTWRAPACRNAVTTLGHVELALPATRWRSNALAGMAYIEDIHRVPRSMATSRVVVHGHEQGHRRGHRAFAVDRPVAPPCPDARGHAGRRPDERKSGIQPSAEAGRPPQRRLGGASDPHRHRRGLGKLAIAGGAVGGVAASSPVAHERRSSAIPASRS